MSNKKGNPDTLIKINELASNIQKQGGTIDECVTKYSVGRKDALKRAGRKYKNTGRKISKPVEKLRKKS